MRHFTFLVSILILFSLACALTGAVTPMPEPTVEAVAGASSTPEAEAGMPGGKPPHPVPLPSGQAPSQGKPGSPCGNGVCEGPENAQNCPADCGATGVATTAAGPEAGQEYRVTNPASGVSLAVYVSKPADAGDARLPTVVLVPGGSGDSSKFRTPQGEATLLAQAGYLVVAFDADGRGQSAGQEDYNGFVHQDGLAAVVAFAASLPNADPQRIALVSYSYGITMASGALARHPDLPVKFLIDWEGPANRDDTGGCDGAGLGHLKQVAACTDEAFWAQREASTFIGQVRVPYQRIQSEEDHVQPDNAHAILMVDNAVAGGVPWVRLNDLPPNQTYDPANPPAMLPEDQSRSLPQLTLKYLEAMFALQ
ncbi:MAG: alpha/beta hydrolase family protein [Chloroflexota bacterium]